MNQQQALPLRLKNIGLDAVEHSSRDWVQYMREAAIEVAKESGSVDADYVRACSRFMNFHPHSPNAYGAIFRGKRWKCIGRKKSTWPSNHAREIRVWTWV
jgi:hypothetical protein